MVVKPFPEIQHDIFGIYLGAVEGQHKQYSHWIVTLRKTHL